MERLHIEEKVYKHLENQKTGNERLENIYRITKIIHTKMWDIYKAMLREIHSLKCLH